MSRTTSIVCHDCREAFWYGQSMGRGRYGIYNTIDNPLSNFAYFLVRHQGHNIEAIEDNSHNAEFDCDEYKAMEDINNFNLITKDKNV